MCGSPLHIQEWPVVIAAAIAIVPWQRHRIQTWWRCRQERKQKRFQTVRIFNTF